MNDKYLSKLKKDSECWRLVKRHFIAIDHDHMIGLIERMVELNKQNETKPNELDS